MGVPVLRAKKLDAELSSEGSTTAAPAGNLPHHGSSTVLLKLQYNITDEGWWWGQRPRWKIFSVAAGAGLGLVLLLLLVICIALQFRKGNKNKTPIPEGGDKRAFKDSLVTADSSGHKAQLLPSAESLNQSPFDKDFSFDFSPDLGGSIGYHPASYTLDPPCQCVPPCHCWQNETNHDVDTEDSLLPKGTNTHTTSDIIGTRPPENEKYCNASNNEDLAVLNMNTVRILTESQPQSPCELQPGDLHAIFIEGFASLRVVTDPEVHKLVSPGAEMERSFSSFKTTSTPTTERRTSSISLPLKGFLKAGICVNKSSTSPSIFNNNDDEINICYYNKDDVDTSKTCSESAIMKKADNCRQIRGSGSHYCVEAGTSSALEKLDLSSDSGFCEPTPSVSPFSHCYRTLPLHGRNVGIKCIPEERMSSTTLKFTPESHINSFKNEAYKDLAPFICSHDKGTISFNYNHDNGKTSCNNSDTTYFKCDSDNSKPASQYMSSGNGGKLSADSHPCADMSSEINMESWTRSLPSKNRRKCFHVNTNGSSVDADKHFPSCRGSGEPPAVLVYRERTAL